MNIKMSRLVVAGVMGYPNTLGFVHFEERQVVWYCILTGCLETDTDWVLVLNAEWVIF